MNPKLTIIYLAVNIRLKNGEDIDDILASYPSLSFTDRNAILDRINEEQKEQ